MHTIQRVRLAHPRLSAAGVRVALAAVVAATMTLATVSQALAHEEREVGPYEVEVGFIDEPVFVGQKSGLEFSFFRDGEPVEGLEETLQAEVIKDDQRRDLPISPRFGEPGWYQSIFFPTAEGPYTFHIFGTVEDTAVDESFTSGPDTFSSVEAATGGQFPMQFPPPDELADDAGRGAGAADLMPLALGLGGAGLLAGLVALGLALALRRRPA